MYDIPAILTRLNIQYKTQGNNYKFPCIDISHHDENPSMSMNDEGVYRCWSCPERGNLHRFVKLLTGQSLNDFLDIKDPTSFSFKMNLMSQNQKSRKEFAKTQERKIKMNGLLHDVTKDNDVMEYLISINMNHEFIKFFDVKYARHIKIKFFENVDYTDFYNRICIPVYRDKRLINMIGRDFTGKETDFKEIYPKGSISDTFFNIDNIDMDKPVIVVEGMKGLVRIWQHFNKNVVSSFGSMIGKGQRDILRDIKSLLVFCDNDEAGWRMVDEIYKLRNMDFCITAMREKGYDPADGTCDDLEYALKHPITSVDYFLRRNNLIQKPLEWK